MTQEDFRHQCEVRGLLRLGREQSEYFRGLVIKHRGMPAARRLWKDVIEQAKLGNKGEPGDWRTSGDDMQK